MEYQNTTQKHPCFSETAHCKFARVHLAVAPMCNIACKFCIRSLNKTENRPGVAAKILTPEDSIGAIEDAMKKFPVTVVGIAGPGDPLFNPATFQVFEMVEKKYPDLLKCLSTNGLLLLDSINKLKKIKLSTLTVTTNALTPETAEQIYDFINLDGETHRGIEAAKILVQRQKEGIKEAVKLGIPIKINSVFIPEINAEEIPRIAEFYGKMGVTIMNIMPLLPINKMAGKRPPSGQELEDMRARCEKYVPQFRLCKQCRADAVGIPAFEKKCALGASGVTDYFHF